MLPFTLLQALHLFAAGCGSQKSFFNFPTWYEYLPNGVDANGNCTPKFVIPDSLPLVVLALVDIALRVAALVAVVFVVYGGFKYTTSQGDPQGVSNARSTIIGALAGLAITIIAAAFVSFVGNKLGGT